MNRGFIEPNDPVGFGTEGWGFESLRPRHTFEPNQAVFVALTQPSGTSCTQQFTQGECRTCSTHASK